MSFCFKTYENNQSLLNTTQQWIRNILKSGLNTPNGIHVCVESSLNNASELNIKRPLVLKQSFGETSIALQPNCVMRQCYGSSKGSASNTVGIDIMNMVTRDMDSHLQSMARILETTCSRELNKRGCSNLVKPHLNQCQVLIYYGIKGYKQKSVIPIHCDCVYNKDGKFVASANSQVENTPTISYTVCGSRKMYFQRRYIDQNTNNWVEDSGYKKSFVLCEGDVMLLHPYDEKPRKMRIQDYEPIVYGQYQHGSVKVNMNELSIVLVFRQVNNLQKHCMHTNKRIFDTSKEKGEFRKLVEDNLHLSFDPNDFQSKLLDLFEKSMI